MNYTNRQLYMYAGFALLVIVGVYVVIKKAPSFGYAVAKTAVNTVDAAGAGLIVGVGNAVGIPETDAVECARCKAIRDYFGVSKFCTASDFISWIVTGK